MNTASPRTYIIISVEGNKRRILVRVTWEAEIFSHAICEDSFDLFALCSSSVQGISLNVELYYPYSVSFGFIWEYWFSAPRPIVSNPRDIVRGAVLTLIVYEYYPHSLGGGQMSVHEVSTLMAQTWSNFLFLLIVEHHRYHQKSVYI